MTEQNAQRPTRMRWLKPSTFAMALVFCSALIVVLAFEALNKINALNTANSDNGQWSLSQSEVEYLSFYNSVLMVIVAPDKDLADLRKWFNVFYSRMKTIQDGSLYNGLITAPALVAPLENVNTFLAAMIPLIDGPDARLRDALPQVLPQIESLRSDVRRITLQGITVFSHQSDVQREAVSSTMYRIAVLTLGLVCALLLLVFFLARLYRTSQTHAAESQQTRDRLGAMLKTSLDAVLVVDRQGRFVEFNGAAEVIFGYSTSEAIGQEMTALIFPDHMIAPHKIGMARYLETGEEHVIGKGRVQLEARRKSGDVFPVELSIAKTQSQGGEIFVAFLRDISDRVVAEQRLMKARDDAQSSERAKAHFLAVMSHEMRTPLNGLLGTLDMLKRTHLSAKQVEYLSVMQASGRMLLHHVNDVLDIAKLEAGKMTVDKTVFDLEDLVREVLDGQRPLAQAGGNTLQSEAGAGAIGTVVGDAVGLRQVLLNLIGNAIKFTRNGTISVESEVLASSDTEKTVEIRVSDTGLGISEADIEQVFEDFVTLDTSFGRRAEGTGLGLGIARRLIRAMGGDIGAESEQGEGSLFWIRLPLGVPESDPGSATDPKRSAAVALAKPAATGLNVLVVEDNQINRFIAREMLEADGHLVTEANDGDEGVALASRVKFDLILMDISMPRLDGVEAARQIRAAGGASARTPIIALTAHALPDDIVQFKAAGMDATVTKPVDSETIRAAIEECMTKRQGITWSRRVSDLHLGDQILDSDIFGQLREGLGWEKTHALVGRFLSEGDATIAAITQSIEQDDKATATARVHSLAGSAGTFGAARLRQLLSEMEQNARLEQFGLVKDACPQLATLWAETRAAFASEVAAAAATARP